MYHLAQKLTYRSLVFVSVVFQAMKIYFIAWKNNMIGHT